MRSCPDTDIDPRKYTKLALILYNLLKNCLIKVCFTKRKEWINVFYLHPGYSSRTREM